MDAAIPADMNAMTLTVTEPMPSHHHEVEPIHPSQQDPQQQHHQPTKHAWFYRAMTRLRNMTRRLRRHWIRLTMRSRSRNHRRTRTIYTTTPMHHDIPNTVSVVPKPDTDTGHDTHVNSVSHHAHDASFVPCELSPIHTSTLQENGITSASVSNTHLVAPVSRQIRAPTPLPPIPSVTQVTDHYEMEPVPTVHGVIRSTHDIDASTDQSTSTPSVTHSSLFGDNTMNGYVNHININNNDDEIHTRITTSFDTNHIRQAIHSTQPSENGITDNESDEDGVMDILMPLPPPLVITNRTYKSVAVPIRYSGTNSITNNIATTSTTPNTNDSDNDTSNSYSDNDIVHYDAIDHRYGSTTSIHSHLQSALTEISLMMRELDMQSDGGSVNDPDVVNDHVDLGHGNGHVDVSDSGDHGRDVGRHSLSSDVWSSIHVTETTDDTPTPTKHVAPDSTHDTDQWEMCSIYGLYATEMYVNGDIDLRHGEVSTR